MFREFVLKFYVIAKVTILLHANTNNFFFCLVQSLYNLFIDFQIYIDIHVIYYL